MFSSDFCHFGDFSGLGAPSRLLGNGFVDRCSVFEGPGELEMPFELWSSLTEIENERGLLGRYTLVLLGKTGLLGEYLKHCCKFYESRVVQLSVFSPFQFW